MRVQDQLKTEIDQLDESYLKLLYNIIRQFPHDSKKTQQKASGQHIASIFQDIASNGGLGISNPKQWQKETRKDRSLPFREV